MDPLLQRLEPFWYPLLPMQQLGAEPVAVTLLGRSLVVWVCLASPARPAAADRSGPQ
ncbi:MAG: hypothetical protein NTY67_06970 [Cyanobacteria bacterium]|nr:hypothetical protein [Cyanobacteriota bacterium]